jgi:RNase P protein component
LLRLAFRLLRSFQTLELLEQAAAATGRTVKCGRVVLKAGSAALKRNLSKREPRSYR